jgi:murein peptide amidase A
MKTSFGGVPKTSRLLARSAGGREIEIVTLGDPRLPKFVLIGGIHGDEPEGSQIVVDFIRHAESQVDDFKACVLVIPRYNPDGLDGNERTNGNGVDLNRNFPAKDWSSDHRAPRYFPGSAPSSEPETRALVDLLAKEKPFLVVHCHTYIPQVCYTGEISRPWAEILAKEFGHPVTEDIGYPTPGSLGQYCLHDLKTACVCIELPERVEQGTAWKMVGSSLLEIARRGP